MTQSVRAFPIHRVIGAIAAAAFVPGSMAWAQTDGEGDALTIVSWGGVYQTSQREAYFKPFTEETGVAIEEDTYPGDFDEVIEQVE